MIDTEKKVLNEELSELKHQLDAGLNSVLQDIGKKLKPHEVEAIKAETDDIKELIERLETGLIFLALFGRTSVGKSALANALINNDHAKVGVEHDLTGTVTYYVKEPWNIGDIPGIMGNTVNKDIALTEAKKAHGHIFVIDGEPYAEEIELFDFVSSETPKSPRLVFVNKTDKFDHMPKKDVEIVKARIYEKMRKYVKSDDDIIYGSAELYDRASDTMVRQSLPQLEEALYGDTTTLGTIMNIFDPAHRAEGLADSVRTKILESRRKVARRIINAYALGQVGSSLVPFGELVVTPGLLATLTYSLVKIMGTKDDPNFDKKKVAKDILRVCGEFLFVDFIGVALIDTGADFLGFGFGGVLLDIVGMSYFKYRRTLIFGEAVLLYIENGFTFGSHGKEMVKQAKKLAAEHYEKFKSKQ